MIFNPHPYQQYAIDYMLKRTAAGLFLEMGLGKTIITLTALQQMGAGKVLVIAPLRVAQTVWAEEAAKWEHTKGLKVSKVLGSASERMRALQTKADVYVINRENVCWLVDSWPWDFDTVVIDELSSFKSRSAQRFKALKQVRAKISRIYGLTGTPTSNGLLDLWSQVYLLDRGQALGRTLGGYRERYFSPGRRNGHIVYEWNLKPMAEEAICRRLEGLCMSMRAEDYLSLPPRVENFVWVNLTQAQRKKYDQMERTYLLPLADVEIQASNAAVVAGKLLQLANGAVYDEAHVWHTLHDAKLDALEEVAEAHAGEPILVYYAYKSDLERLQGRFTKARPLRGPADVEAWNKGQISMLLAHPDSAGHGLNLQAGGRIIVWFGLTWSLEKDQQANARIYRQGQTKPVMVHRIVAQSTIDEAVLKALEGKADIQQALIEAVKAKVGGL